MVYHAVLSTRLKRKAPMKTVAPHIKKPEKTEEVARYIQERGERGELLGETMYAFTSMRIVLDERGSKRAERGDSLVKYDPYRGQGRILVALAEGDGIRQAVLAQRVGVSRQTLSTALKKLEAAGLVKRRKDPMDARSLLVFLTQKGMQYKEQLDEEERYSGSMFEVLTDEELASMISICQKLEERLRNEIEVKTRAEKLLAGQQ